MNELDPLTIANAIDYPDVQNGIEAAKAIRRLHEANQAMLEALKLAEESLGSFVSDHGWSQQDMDNLDIVTAAITKANKGTA